jgi:four helix bundle protein
LKYGDAHIMIKWGGMTENVVKTKSFNFAVRIVRLQRFLVEKKRERTLSRQLLRSGTSVGAMIREAEHAQSRKDFIHKLSIAQKEINESIYWLEILRETSYLSLTEFNSIHAEALEILKLLTTIIRSSKQKNYEVSKQKNE